MSRIQDALAKLQARQTSEQKNSRSMPTRIGTVVEHAGDGLVPPPHAYGGKRIEIDFDELEAQGLLAPGAQSKLIADEYRTIKRRLLKVAATEGEALSPNLVMVASALPGEGKTFTCVNLSLSIANERDWDVVLVDGDCLKPHLTKLFGAELEPGLMDLLRTQSRNFDSVVMPTNVPGLSVMPAGSRDENAAELLASSMMEALCAQAAGSNRARVIIFDSSPLLLTSEAEALAEQVGQIVLVVRAEKTLQESVIQALEKLDRSMPLGLVLNQASAGSGRALYGDYYADASS
jgi:exopolysaccharide/PEP-CTERM locus tyrosine autokinase